MPFQLDLEKLRSEKAAFENRLVPHGQSGTFNNPHTGKTDVIFVIDLSRSCFPVHKQISKDIARIIDKVNAYNIDARFGFFYIRNHHDESAYKELYYSLPPTNDIKKITEFQNSIKRGGGGTNGKNLFCCIVKNINDNIAQQSSLKLIVCFMDEPPCSAKECPEANNFESVLNILKGKGVKFYTVFVGKKPGVKEYYKNLSDALFEPGSFTEFDILLPGIVLSTHPEYFRKYFSEIRQNKSLTTEVINNLKLLSQ